MIWWASQPSRARSERQGIAELEEQNDWLRGVSWRLTEGARLCADFEIEHLGTEVPLTLTYPNFFPDMPPQITPRGDILLSNHQYGPGGELCLEYRPDTWEPSITGAMMIESARRLLVGEQPAPGESAEVASAHRTTLGQEVRNATLRFLVPEDAKAALTNVPLEQAVKAEIVEHLVAKHWLAFPRRVGEAEAPYWEDRNLPDRRTLKGYFIRLDRSWRARIKPEFEFIEALVGLVDHEDAASRLARSNEELSFFIECAGVFRLISLAVGTGKRTVFNYKTVAVPPDGNRLPDGYRQLSEVSVAIVGCGSVGSKIAASLARAGVGKFVLVDGDLFFRGNLVRHDLDWGEVGLNKPDAVAVRIREIAPRAEVLARRINLGGQESSASTDSALTAIGASDVIVDATADPQVFNLCGAVARNERKPLVWGEVFGGGVGGLVARLRPDLDPVPHSARRQIIDWCSERGGAPVETGGLRYGLAQPEGAPLIADDAEVTLIAGHMTRLVLDLLANQISLFPQSAYAIGFRPGWIFDAPFDTWPITLTAEGDWGPEKDDHLSEELDAFIAEFFPSLPGDPAG